VTGVTIDHSGRIYTIHGLGFSQGLLAAYSSSGTLLFESTTGIGPTALAASSRDDVYVVCGGSDQLVVHHGKSVFSTMALPSGVAGIALDHRGGFALSRPGEDRVLFSSVSGTYAVPVVGGPNGIAFGGDGRVILSCSVSGAVQWMWPQGGAGEFAYGSPGLVSHGDMTGYHWAATAGCGSDSDGDGFTNAEEIAAGSHPFDVLSAPMSIAVVSGPSGLCHIESMGTPGAVFFLGFSHGRKSRGAGYLGLSLAADAVALASLHSSVFQASPLSAFNAIGMQNVILNLAALLAVAPVWASFVALPEFPNPTGWIASPAMKLQLQ
jgi:hypothetical protein